MNQIELFKVFMSSTAGDKVSEILYSGYIGQGKKVEEFERNLADFVSTDFVSTLNSGTSALHLALHLIKQKFNDESFEVITTPLTCTATNWPILANGLKIKWADIDPKTMNIDLDDVARKITKDTKAIMLVHWGGYPVDMNKLENILDQAEKIFGFRLIVIEDCAHALGSYYNGRHVGTRHGFGCFSFQAIKHITSVDGGMLICPNQDFHKKTRLLRWYGIDRESNRKDFRCEANIDNWGFNQTINLSEVELLIANVEGVQSVPMLKVINKCGGIYSVNSYNIDAATKNKIVYPSLDPSVFEVKYPDTDIKGRAR